jgi:thermitase
MKPSISLGLAVSAALLASSASAAGARLLVKPRPELPEAALRALLAANGGREHSRIAALGVRIVEVPEQAAARILESLRKDPQVEFAEPDFIATAVGSANDPYFSSGNQWYLSKIQVPAAWDYGTGAPGVTVAVIDSGVLASHPDLAGKVLAGYDFHNADADPSDDNGHGTAVAGLAAAASNNQLGMAGIAWANPVLPAKVLGADGSGSYSAISNAITWAADRGARVINLSLGGTSSSRTLQQAVDYAWNRNAVVIAAAGNNGNNITFYPAACTNVVAVSATNASDLRPSWSNFGSYVDLAAPGENILTLQGTASYSSWNGTSFSSPITAGVVALMISANPGLSNRAVVDLLLRNADDIGSAGYDVYYGNGRVNAYRAVAAAANAATLDQTPPVASILSPADGATVSGTVPLSLAATDNVGVTRLELWIDGVLASQTSAASTTLNWDSTLVADGSHSLEARAYDAANLVGSRRITVQVRNSASADVLAPVTAISSPANGSRISSKSMKVAVAASDNVRVTKVELYINGRLHGTSTTVPASFSWSTSKLAAGAHTLQSFAYDAAGNTGSSALVTVYK